MLSNLKKIEREHVYPVLRGDEWIGGREGCPHQYVNAVAIRALPHAKHPAFVCPGKTPPPHQMGLPRFCLSLSPSYSQYSVQCLDIKGGLSLTYEMQVWKFSHFSLKVDNGGKSGSGRWPIGCICHEIARPSSHYLYQVFSLLPLFLSSLCPLLPLLPPL